MDYQKVTEQQAIEMLRVWSRIGRDLASVAKLQADNNQKLITVILPGYCDNEWYQVGDNYSCYTEAFSNLGGLLDKAYGNT